MDWGSWAKRSNDFTVLEERGSKARRLSTLVTEFEDMESGEIPVDLKPFASDSGNQ